MGRKKEFFINLLERFPEKWLPVFLKTLYRCGDRH